MLDGKHPMVHHYVGTGTGTAHIGASWRNLRFRSRIVLLSYKAYVHTLYARVRRVNQPQETSIEIFLLRCQRLDCFSQTSSAMVESLT